MFRILQIAALSMALSVSVSPALHAEPNVWVLRNVNVLPMTGEGLLPNRDVVVRDGRIASIHATGVDHGSLLVIEGKEGYLIPGLTDMHVHLGTREMLAMNVANGITTIRVMAGDQRILDMKAEVAAGKLIGPRMFVASPLLEGDPPLWPESKPVTTPEQARSLVSRYAAEGYQAIKIYDGLTPAVLQAVADQASREGLPVVGHLPDTVALDDLLAVRPASLEHTGGYLPDWLTTGRGFCDMPPEELEQLAGRLAAGRIPVVPTLSLFQYPADAKARETVRGRPEFELLPPGVTRGFWPGATPSPGSERAKEAQCKLGSARTFLKAFVSAGGEILAGTDTPNPWLIPGYALHNELSQLVTAGLNPARALAAATSGAASVLGSKKHRGIVAVGQPADLVLLEANPLEDIHNTQRIAGVVLRGHWWSRDDLDTLVASTSAKTSE